MHRFITSAMNGNISLGTKDLLRSEKRISPLVLQSHVGRAPFPSRRQVCGAQVIKLEALRVLFFFFLKV